MRAIRKTAARSFEFAMPGSASTFVFRYYYSKKRAPTQYAGAIQRPAFAKEDAKESAQGGQETG